jgi:hypothetical protein
VSQSQNTRQRAAPIAGEKGIELCPEAEDFRKALTSAGFDGGWKKTFGAEAWAALGST